MDAAQSTLISLGELLRREREALAAEAENTVRAIDDEIERHLGAKERAMGALRQHRADHGC